MSQPVANTFKFSTFIFLVLGVIVPFWPISLPLFWYLAYRSYKSGGAAEVALVGGGASAATEISEAKKLLDQGAISQEEFDEIKRRALG